MMEEDKNNDTLEVNVKLNEVFTMYSNLYILVLIIPSIRLMVERRKKRWFSEELLSHTVLHQILKDNIKMIYEKCTGDRFYRVNIMFESINRI
mmetsp:Transcript_5131/g.5044  ORF Transcript_5131/g.5044 Transcript_5131/m.5044 type:complete len:93 (+) Transcript_5131:330-608(+)